MITQINSFDQIEIIPNSLVVFDIDDTLIKFDGIDLKWWKNKVKRYMVRTRDEKLAESMANADLIKIMNTCDPELVDDQVHNFITRLTESNCQIILLTARDENLRELTCRHLESVNLNFDQIYFNENKGDELKKIVRENYPNISTIIMIDDMLSNLEDVKEKFTDSQYDFKLYNIKY